MRVLERIPNRISERMDREAIRGDTDAVDALWKAAKQRAKSEP